MLAKKCDVKIHKGALTVIPKTVYEHEVKLLEVLYGVGSIVKYDRKEIFTPPKQSYIEEGDVVLHGVEEIDHDDEYSRLFMAYGNHPTINLPLVEHCYGDQDGRKLESANNEKYAQEKRNVVKNNVVGESELPTTSEEGNQESEERQDYSEMTYHQLKKLLKFRKIKFPHNTTKVAMIKLLEDGDS
tara:strand:- start:6336 stop:6893 length:558 start_codon:yes stop_codon:yes gene_type:complete